MTDALDRERGMMAGIHDGTSPWECPVEVRQETCEGLTYYDMGNISSEEPIEMCKQCELLDGGYYLERRRDQ